MYTLRRRVRGALLFITIQLAGQVTLAQHTSGVSGEIGLQQCIDLALQNNITIRQGQLTVQNNTLQVKQAQLNLLPTASFQGTQSLSSGRNIDPFTNQFVQQTISSNNYQLNGSATLYNGFTLRNTIHQNQLTQQASEQELLVTRNTVMLNVIQAYLNALTATEQLVIAQRQAEVARTQIDRTQRLVNAGSAPESNLFDLRATLASNELDIVTAQNSLDLAKVTLLQNMNVPVSNGETGFTIQPINVPDPGLTPYAESVQQIYEAALSNLPDAKGADMRVRSAEMAVEVARGALYPTLAVSGNLNSLYSSAAANRKFTPNGQQVQQAIPSYFVVAPDGSQQPVYTMTTGGTQGRFTYFEQLNNNLNRSLSLILRVPIFQGNLSRNRITTAKIQQQNASLNAENIRLQVRQQVETAYANMKAGANRYRATLAQVESLTSAYRVAESRYNAGALGSFEYGIAKTNLDRSRASLIQAKYDYVFRIKILDYYQNKPLSF